MEVADALTKDINVTNEEVFKKCHPFHPSASSWWNTACDTAVHNLCDAPNQAARKAAYGRLKGTGRTVRTAKRFWADEYIEKAQL